MGQKVNPYGFRLGINKTWDSRWFAEDKYSEFLENDLNLRKHILEKLRLAGISKVLIERSSKKTLLSIYTARPGVVKDWIIKNIR